jgi:hypothetical protein
LLKEWSKGAEVNEGRFVLNIDVLFAFNIIALSPVYTSKFYLTNFIFTGFLKRNLAYSTPGKQPTISL